MFKRLFKGLFITFVIIMLGLISYGYYHKKNNKAMKFFGNYISVVISGSMEPTIMTDDLIFYKEKDTYEIDDIIVFQFDGSLIVHRIIEDHEDGYVTKGDNNNTDDFLRYGYIKDYQILGKVSNNYQFFGIGKLLY